MTNGLCCRFPVGRPLAGSRGETISFETPPRMIVPFGPSPVNDPEAVTVKLPWIAFGDEAPPPAEPAAPAGPATPCRPCAPSRPSLPSRPAAPAAPAAPAGPAGPVTFHVTRRSLFLQLA